MSEMIHAHLESIKDKESAGNVKLIDDAFFQEETVKGLTFHVRRSNFMRFLFITNLMELSDEKRKAQEAIEQEEAKKDMTYEEYLEKYQMMMDGKAGSIRDDPPKSQHASRPVTGIEENKSDNGSKKGKSNPSQGGRSAANSQYNTKDGFGTGGDDWKTDPEGCLIPFQKGNKIADLEKKFVLLAHHTPIIEGEMVMFQVFDEDQIDDTTIMYRDYSLKRRYPTQVAVGQKKLTSF